MRNKLPIVLALVLTAAAAMPWLRSLELQHWSTIAGPTTVPPPSPMNVPFPSAPVATSAGQTAVAAGTANRPVSSARVAQPASSGTAGPRIEASQLAQINPQMLMDNAVLAVESQPSISAQVSEEGELFGHPLAGLGRYYELRQPIPLIHLEMRVQIDAVSTSLVQVCDGTNFWTYRKLPSGESLSKIDAVRAITAVQQAADRVPPAAALGSPGFGGLGRLVRGLNAQFEFTSAGLDEVDGAPAWKLVGGWKPQVLGRLLPDQRDAAAKGRPYDITRLPARLPDGIAVYLRQKDYFPLRIDYCRSVAKSQPRCLLSLKFSDVSFVGPIDPNQFLYMPSSLEYSDRTDEFVHALGL